jgi:hypothetical protein
VGKHKLCNELDLLSIKILFHIKSAFNDTFAPANDILILTFYSDFDTFVQAQPINPSASTSIRGIDL